MSIYRPRRAPEQEVRAVRGLGMHITRWPGPDPEPWLLLHGWMDTGSTFQFLADALAPTRSLLAPDWRGFGASAWAADGYWFPDYYADLDALIDLLSSQSPITLIGHSMGANIAMMYAGLRPQRVRAVVCIEGYGLPRTHPEQAPARYRTWLDELRGTPVFARFPSYAAFTQYLRKRNPRLPAERAEFIARAWADEAADGGIRMRADPRHKRVNPILYRREEAEACWREIRAPLLFVAGADSDHTRRYAADASLDGMRELIPRFTLVTVANAGHMVHHDEPEALAGAIEQFMTSLEETVAVPR